MARGSGLRASRLAGRVARERSQVVGSGPVGERATPTPLRGQGPLPLGQDLLRTRGSRDLGDASHFTRGQEIS